MRRSAPPPNGAASRHLLVAAAMVTASFTACDLTQELGISAGHAASGNGGAASSKAATASSSATTASSSATTTSSTAAGSAGGVGQAVAGAPPEIAIVWAKPFGGTKDVGLYAMAVDAAGDVVITGNHTGTLDFGGGPLPPAAVNDGYLAKLDPAGNHLWSRTFSSGVGSYGTSVAVDATGHVLVSGAFGGVVDFGNGPLSSAGKTDIFVAKYSPTGTPVWSKRFGGSGGDGGATIAVDPLGNVLVSATYRDGAVDFGCGSLPPAGDYDALVAKLDPAGSCLWSKRFGDLAFQQASAVAADAWGSVVVTGALAGTADFGGGPLASVGEQDVFVAKFDDAGNHLWSKRFGDGQNQIGLSVAVTGSGDIALTGQFNGAIDFGGGLLTSAGAKDVFLAMLLPGAEPLWSRRFGGPADDSAWAVAADASGGVVITGLFREVVDFGGGPLVCAGMQDAFVARYDAAGNHRWSRRFGDALDQSGNGVGFDGAGNLYLGGCFDGSVDCGKGPLSSPGGQSMFVAKFPH